MDSVNYSLTNLTLISFLLGLLSIIIWYLSVKKRKKIWLPILSILQDKKKIPPLIKIKRPLLFPFFCFLICLVTLLLYTTKPEHSYTKKQENKEHLHLLLDLSPSVSSTIDLASYKKKILSFYDQEKKNFFLSISRSRDKKIHKAGTRDDLIKFLESIHFHNESTQISKEISNKLELDKSIDHFVIASDKDQNSWKTFDWKSLIDEKGVFFLQTNNLDDSESNVYFSEAFYKGSTDHKILWDIVLQRSGHTLQRSGTLKVSINGAQLAKKNWAIRKDENKTTVRMTWTKSQTPHESVAPNLMWEITSDQKDLILLDNNYTTPLTGKSLYATIIADPFSESSLEDPAYHLISFLQVFGYQTKRLDWFESKSPLDSNPSLVISFIKSSNNSLDRYCPSNTIERNNKPLILWIAPEIHQQNLQTLCTCTKQIIAKTKDMRPPFSCPDTMTEDVLSQLMHQEQAQQIGGSLGQNLSAFAWRIKLQDNTKELIVFTKPLTPSLRTGLTHNKLPYMLKTILNWQKIEDSQEILQIKNTSSNSHKNKIHQVLSQNVPEEESELKELGLTILPKSWESIAKETGTQMNNPKQERSALPWIVTFLLFLLGSLLLESLYNFKKGKSLKTLTSLLFFIFVLNNKQVFANLTLNYYSTTPITEDFRIISYDLSGRTSLEIEETIKVFSTNNPSLYQSPWIWTKYNEDILSKPNNTNYQLLLDWIKRGGFLVIEGVKHIANLSHLATDLTREERDPIQWETIPLDHELLRSFYLLNTLPSCQSDSWYILQSDKRLSIIASPYSLIEKLQKRSHHEKCPLLQNKELLTRTFINITMVALTTNYKKDQIHLNEILKRLD